MFFFVLFIFFFYWCFIMSLEVSNPSNIAARSSNVLANRRNEFLDNMNVFLSKFPHLQDCEPGKVEPHSKSVLDICGVQVRDKVKKQPYFVCLSGDCYKNRSTVIRLYKGSTGNGTSHVYHKHNITSSKTDACQRNESTIAKHIETADPLFCQDPSRYPNGLSISNQNHLLIQDLQTCYNYGAAVLCLPETNTNWHAEGQIATLRQIFRGTWKSSVLQPSRTPEPFLSTHQPGGTLTAVCDNWTSHVIMKGEDPFGIGRWSYITQRAKVK